MNEKTSMFELLNERMEKEDIVKLVSNYDNKFNELEEENKQLKSQLQQKDKELEAKKQLINKQDKELWTLEHTIKEVREYIKALRNYRFNVDLGENREQLEIVGSTENFVKDILEILDKEL